MKDGTGHREHVAHGDGHVNFSKSSVNLEIVGTVLEGPRIVPADLRADTCGAFQACLYVD